MIRAKMTSVFVSAEPGYAMVWKLDRRTPLTLLKAFSGKTATKRAVAFARRVGRAKYPTLLLESGR